MSVRNSSLECLLHYCHKLSHHHSSTWEVLLPNTAALLYFMKLGLLENCYCIFHLNFALLLVYQGIEITKKFACLIEMALPVLLFLGAEYRTYAESYKYFRFVTFPKNECIFSNSSTILIAIIAVGVSFRYICNHQIGFRNWTWWIEITINVLIRRS